MAVNATPGQTRTVSPMEATDTDSLTALKEKIAEGATKDAVKALPAKLSPSRATDFKKCPKLFFFKTICGISTPGSTATLRGTLAHAAFERIFDHPAGERTADLAVSYIAPAWEAILNPDLEKMNDKDRGYAERARDRALEIITPGTEAEAELLAAAEDCVRKWFDMERVNNFSPTDLTLPNGRVIDGRELYVIAKLTGIKVHGFIDRLDRYVIPTGEVRWTISDYKTTPVAPWLKKDYPAHTVERIRKEAFFQLLVYAVLAWKMYGIKVNMLRLIYVGSGDRERGIQSMTVNQQLIDATIADLEKTWREINTAARTGVWETRTSPLCQWCPFQDVCPAWSNETTDVSGILADPSQ